MHQPEDNRRRKVYGSTLLSASQAARPDGITYKYFQSTAWEPELRQQFCIALESLHRERVHTPDLLAALTALNHRYRTRAKAEHVQYLTRLIPELCAKYEWLTVTPPDLLSCSDEGVTPLGRSIEECLHQMEQANCRRTYSLLTKAMHFLFPNSFAIHDSQICSSIWTLRVYSGDTLDGVTTFRTAASLTTGENYSMILSTYREVWRYSSSEYRIAAQGAVEGLNRLVQRTQQKACVTVLDIIDKYLWHADGHPKRLGLPVLIQ